jgi:DNA repair photolyase
MATVAEPLLFPTLSSPEAWSTLPTVRSIKRLGSVLHPSPMFEDGGVLALNVARGCGAHCAFCPARTYPNYPGDEILLLYQDTSENLEKELRSRSSWPRAVFISPATDPFPPLEKVQAETLGVVEVLAHHGIEAWLMTRGLILPQFLETLVSYRDHLKIQVMLTTLDPDLQQVLEPLTGHPSARITQIAELRQRGVAVQVGLEPLVPGLTDTRENLLPLLEQLAAVKTQHVTTSYMFLRQGIIENLDRALEKGGYDRSVLDAFTEGPLLEAPGIARARYLPKSRRQHGYAAIMVLAASLGMTVSISITTNPDFSAGPSRRR